MSRYKARVLLMQILFQAEAQGDFSQASPDLLLEEEALDGLSRDYIVSTFEAYRTNKEEIDSIIDRNMAKWDLRHLPKAELAILRLGATEILCTDVPDAVAINEAVNLAKKFGEEKAPGFINGVLGAVARSKEEASVKED